MPDEYDRRTAVTRIAVSESDRELLEQTITEWKRACQLAADLVWNRAQSRETVRRGEVQSLTYDEIRNRTSVGSQHAILATRRAADAIASCLEQRARGKRTSKPQFTAPTVTYDQRSMTMFDNGSVSLATVEDRIQCQLVLPKDDSGYQHQFLDSDDWTLTESTLTVRDSDFYLHLGFRRPLTDTRTAENGTVLGVDLGVENVAVTSTAKFYSGSRLNHRRDEFERVRGSLQRCGTRSARRTLKRVGGRQRRYTDDVLHRVSNGIVAEALRYDYTAIAVENLDDIKERLPNASWFHMWAFRRVIGQLEYKCRERGIRLVKVNPEHTSQRCAECGHSSSANRPSRDRFRCERCGNRGNADYNAAKNIGFRYVRRGQQPSRRTGHRQLALKSGTVSPNGEFDAYPDGFEDEFTDKLRSESSARNT